MESGNATFIAVYETNVVQGKRLKYMSGNVLIEIFKGPRDYGILLPTKGYIYAPGDSQSVSQGIVKLREDSYHVVFSRQVQYPKTALSDSFDAEIQRDIDQGISLFSAISGPDVLGTLRYRGWIVNENSPIAPVDFMIKVLKPVNTETLQLKEMAKEIERHLKKSDEFGDRVRLVSRFYSRSVGLPPGEEKFLSLWTVLEIYPMKGNHNLKYIRQELSKITGKPINDISDRLEIGKIFKLRGELLLNGRFSVNGGSAIEFTVRLNKIVFEILRHMCGLPYSGSLDEFFATSKSSSAIS